eukprot:CAMPEP_0175097012 /NCGR_PEP_ID=MMETSP0086_2-20121207/5050_1 /TAXON_ID=136419 /ORGANISM="Unknown Unknown, Strain D1" /LENGTH=93 /DNA_ID=CAMNT_0016370475 /DNA_START=255 /DNA_END=536 /DNA_ORIENTATION=+
MSPCNLVLSVSTGCVKKAVMRPATTLAAAEEAKPEEVEGVEEEEDGGGRGGGGGEDMLKTSRQDWADPQEAHCPTRLPQHARNCPSVKACGAQ